MSGIETFLLEGALPFLLIFVTTFAILQRTKILGEDKTQIDAIVGLAIGLILVLTPLTRDLINQIIPWLGVGVAALLLFFILWGFVEGDLTKSDKENKRLWYTRRVLLGIISFFVILVIIFTTGLYEIILSTVMGPESILGGEFWSYLAMAVVITIAIIVAVTSGKKEEKEGG